jgi:hypothetical protein
MNKTNNQSLHDFADCQKQKIGADDEAQLDSGAAAEEPVELSVGSQNSGSEAEAVTEADSMSRCLGAPPSNTAPSNYIDLKKHSKILRFGVDSLYLSYQGDLSSGWDQRLEGLKLAAQSQQDIDKSAAQVNIGNHLFEVSGKGQQRFPYVLVDNCYRIQLSKTSAKSMPLAYVQISSELLTTVSVDEAVSNLNFIINTLGAVKGEPQISRADIFVDYTCPLAMDSWHPLHWVTRAHKVWSHYERRLFSGWSIGLGGNLSARLYNKTLELEKSKKDYLKPLWQMAGWDEESLVWRLEFEFHREALKELSTLEVPHLLRNIASLWRYACLDWLRLTIPNEQDSNQTRWPSHPFWDFISNVSWQNQSTTTLKRLRKERVPSDESLFINGLGGITSFMARHGIEDLGEGFGEFLAHADRFHEHKGRKENKGLSHYIEEKVKTKGRKYNTLDNRDVDQLEQQKREEARAYRKERNGD